MFEAGATIERTGSLGKFLTLVLVMLVMFSHDLLLLGTSTGFIQWGRERPTPEANHPSGWAARGGKGHGQTGRRSPEKRDETGCRL